MRNSIYYADDDLDDLELFKRALERCKIGAPLFLYNNGDDFLDGIKKGREAEKALVFLDMNMPGKNGLAVLREMRQTEGLKSTPVIIYSTSNDPASAIASKVEGANMYVTKPSSFSHLSKMIECVTNIDWERHSNAPGSFMFGN